MNKMPLERAKKTVNDQRVRQIDLVSYDPILSKIFDREANDAGCHHSRLTQLLLPEKHKESNRHGQIHQQCHPEPRFPKPWHGAGREIGEDITGANLIGRCCPRQDGGDGTEHLSRNEREENVEASQRLQQYHAEPDALHGIQDTKPQPQTPARDGGRGGTARPGEVEADV